MSRPVRAPGPKTNRRVGRIAGPIVLSNATVPLIGAVDTGVVGQMGLAAPIGAVGLGAVTWTWDGVFIGAMPTRTMRRATPRSTFWRCSCCCRRATTASGRHLSRSVPLAFHYPEAEAKAPSG